MSKKKLVFYSFIVLIVHFLLQASFIVYSFALGMWFFDNPDVIVSKLEVFKYDAVSAIASILTFPLVTLVENTKLVELFQGDGGYVVFILNSSIWAIAFYAVVDFVTKINLKSLKRQSRLKTNMDKVFL